MFKHNVITGNATLAPPCDVIPKYEPSTNVKFNFQVKWINGQNEQVMGLPLSLTLSHQHRVDTLKKRA